MSRSSFDVIIAGAGAGGAMAAHDLARAGAKVLVVEKEKLPRYKPCGGGLTEKALDILPFDISSVVEATIHHVRFTFRLREPLDVHYPKPF